MTGPPRSSELPLPSWQQHYQSQLETPTSSAQGSARLTPQSDSEDDRDGDGHDVAVDTAELLGRMGGHHDGGGEAFELQERGDAEKRAHGRDGSRRGDDEYEDEAGYNGGEDEDEEGESARMLAGSARRQQHRRRASVSTAASFQLYTPDEEQAVVRKLDRRLVLFVALLYMLGFLDRSNIGNARIAGMDADLQSRPPRDDWYEWALSAFYVTYIAFEWMSLLWRLVPPHAYVALLVLSWGLTASLQAVAVGYPMLIALRALLGIGEAGFTGIPFYLSFFFKRNELAFRTAIFISAAPLATTFASSLAWLILRLGEGGPIAPWRLLFLLEGFPSVIVAAIAWNVIPDSPQTAPFLTAREKKVARLRLRRQQKEENKIRGPKHKEEGSDDGSRRKKSAASRSGLNARDVLAVLADPAAWITAAMFFLTNMAYASLPVFLPTIIQDMGHDAQSAQAMAAPPYLSAFLIVLATAHISDRLRVRAPLIAGHALASAAGYAVLALSGTGDHPSPGSWLRYVAVFPAAIGFFNVVVLTIAWSINNQRGESRQGGGFALLQAVGQCGPLVGTRLYPAGDGPFYMRGMATCAGAMAGVAVLALVLRWYLARMNRRLAAEEEAEENAEEEEEGLVAGSSGSRRRRGHEPEEKFRYML